VFARHVPEHRTAKGEINPFSLIYPLSLYEHLVQHTCGANFLTLRPINKEYAFLNFEKNFTYILIQVMLFEIFTQFWDIWLNLLHNI